MSEIRKGDVVRVKSGGPKMTVWQVGKAAMTGADTVWCVWFVGNTKHDGTFEPDALEVMSRSIAESAQSASA